ncbi:twin transmembrane helix small protein [Jannaschia aquimarina]|uniref:HIG1 domain-containing protein n=1 Tax=Jannaschia aquimarina TaxID=935700 RepID=A0A0D1EK84_9RHOB|nr:twin transmembrane helix small protein [Jannaschia aquimarina]KIT17989.1 hypothetical protein jaqu_02160 [Jannaschia aquimarina]SNS88060.1 Hypoxia induced protein conserved region [Jannaschia aquimarina]
MIDDPLFLVVAAACLGVLVILMFGIGGFAKGGEFNKKYANKIMRLRVGAQLLAVLLLVGYVWIRRESGN